MSPDRIAVLRTGKLHVFGMASQILSDHRIPHFDWEEGVSGGRYEASGLSSEGPGYWWVIEVPGNFAGEAISLLDSLPCERTVNPDVWDFGPTPVGKNTIRILAAVLLLALVIALFCLCVG